MNLNEFKNIDEIMRGKLIEYFYLKFTQVQGFQYKIE